MKEKEPWIKKFRQRMDGYEEPVPADLWSQLEQELQPAPRVIPWTRRWQAAAAVALLLVTSTLTVWFWQSPSADYLQRQSAEWQQLPAEKTEVMASVPVSDSLKPETPLQSLAAPPVLAKEEAASTEAETTDGTSRWLAVSAPTVNRSDAAHAVLEKPVETVSRNDAERLLSVEEAGKTEDVQDVGEAGAVQNGVVQGQTDVVQGQASVVQRSKRVDKDSDAASNRRAAYASLAGYRQPTETAEKGWSVGVLTGNGALAYSNRSAGYLPLPHGTQGVILNNVYGVQMSSEIDKLVQFKNLSEGKEAHSEIDYKMPVVVGASLRFDLNADWALETGLTYTLLASEAQSGSAKNHYGWEDKLHYVGIPLKVHRRVWSSRRLELYASAGGMVEKCVSGKRTLVGNVSTLGNGPVEKVTGAEEDLDIDPLQVSLSAAAGVQFKLNDRWGIYAEPGVAYFFDDGSEVETIRKEHPFQFNLQLGLRFTFPQ